MKLVVDTSVVIAVIANKPEKPALIELARGMELIAPPSVHWEIGNAFSAMLKRKRVSPEEASEALEIYGKIPIKLVDVELAHSLKIAAQQAIYAYDAYILRCAQKYRCPAGLSRLESGRVREGHGNTGEGDKLMAAVYNFNWVNPRLCRGTHRV